MQIARHLAAIALSLLAVPAGAQTAIYNTTPPVLTANRTQTELQADANANLKTATTGDLPNGATDAGNPIKIGGYANASGTTAVTPGQRVNAWFGVNGQMMIGTFATAPADGTANTLGYFLTSGGGTAPLAAGNYNFNGSLWDRTRGDVNGTVVQPALSSAFWGYAAPASGIVNTTTAVTIKAAAGAGVRNYLCTLNIGHDALGAASELAIRDGAAGTVLFRSKLQTAAIEGNSEINFSPCLKGTANTLMEVVTLTATVSGGTYVNASGYTGI